MFCFLLCLCIFILFLYHRKVKGSNFMVHGSKSLFYTAHMFRKGQVTVINFNEHEIVWSVFHQRQMAISCLWLNMHTASMVIALEYNPKRLFHFDWHILMHEGRWVWVELESKNSPVYLISILYSNTQYLVLWCSL